MITVDSFFSSTLNTVDAVIGNFVNNAYINFIQANSALITLVFTFYIMLIGYQFLSHDHHFNLSQVIKKLIVMLCVYGLVMNWHLYHVFVYNIFTNEPGNIAHILTSAAGDKASPKTIIETLDAIYSAVIQASSGFFGEVSFSADGVAFMFYGGLVYAIGSLMCVFALLLFVYAKMMMAVALALGPLFILFFMWDATKGLFSAWLNKLVTTALIPVVTSAILVLMLSVIKVTLPHLNQPAEDMQFYGIAPFLGLSLATTMILAQVFRICSALGGGITLSSLSTGVSIVSSFIPKLGAGKSTQRNYRAQSNQNRKRRGV